jgi:hypothetical protein
MTVVLRHPRLIRSSLGDNPNPPAAEGGTRPVEHGAPEHSPRSADGDSLQDASRLTPSPQAGLASLCREGAPRPAQRNDVNVGAERGASQMSGPETG